MVSEGDRVTVARVGHLPSPDCVGGRRTSIVLQRLHDHLDQVVRPDALPPAFGPYVTLAEARDVPHGADDPTAWVEALLQREPPRESRGGAPPRPRRSTVGYRFFETFGVARHVRKTFRPDADWGGWLAATGGALPQVAHWVPGANRALLMEPIVPTRATLHQEIRDVATKFAAYRHALDQAEDGRTGVLVAYLTAGGRDADRDAAADTLRSYAHQVVDTTDASGRDAFLAEIEDLAAEAASQPPLPTQS